MAAGVDPTGPMEEISAQGTIDWRVAISSRRVLMILIVLAASMTGLAPDQAAALARLIGF